MANSAPTPKAPTPSPDRLASESDLASPATPDCAPATGGESNTAMAGPAESPSPEADTATRRPKARGKARVVADLDRGLEVIRDTVRRLPQSPGVYRMLDAAGDVLYVGKARNLQRRVTSYTQIPRLPYRLQRMVSETVLMEVVSTHTEAEALLLESNFIKRYMPRYNVLLRDDKSFPFILITGDHEAPQVTKHRGARKRDGDYFGPFASAGAVNRTITALQRAFLLRNCSDSVYASRTRPCLQYQIKRCAAPCVGRISEADYRGMVDEARAFLSGKRKGLQRDLAARMQEASDALDFETAARYRDRIRALTFIQGHQDINVEGVEEADVLGVHQAGGQTCVEVFFFRGGQNYGSRAYYPSHDRDMDAADVLASFIAQFYDDKPPPRAILTNVAPAEAELIGEALALRANRKVELLVPKRGAKAKLVEHAVNNAREALGRRLAESASQRTLLEGVARVFGLDQPPQRIEVYDNSHIQGTGAYGAMIVAGPDGLMKNQYRRFAIKGAAPAGGLAEEDPGPPAGMAEEQAAYDTGAPSPAGYSAGDDFAMMREVLTRRFARILKEDPARETAAWPDLVLIDGGQGQLTVAREVLDELGLTDEITVAAIAKGPERNAGRERFFLPDADPFQLEPRDPILYYLQRLRDEAHRFVIETHRAKRQKQIGANPLDEIDGIGAKRKKALLHHFGSARAVSRAGLADLEAVEGISSTVARRVYDHFHPQG